MGRHAVSVVGPASYRNDRSHYVCGTSDGEGVELESRTATTRRNQEAAVAGDGAQTDNYFGTTAPIPDGANRVLY